MTTKFISGKDLVVGDEVLFLGVPRKVVDITEYPNGGPTINGVHHPARILHWVYHVDGREWDTSMTILDEDDVEIVSTEPTNEQEGIAEFIRGLM